MSPNVLRKLCAVDAAQKNKGGSWDQPARQALADGVLRLPEADKRQLGIVTVCLVGRDFA